jgi:magnesium-transporting ATPase (P-type)
VAATLEIEEAALTGESTPVLKSVDAVPATTSRSATASTWRT